MNLNKTTPQKLRTQASPLDPSSIQTTSISMATNTLMKPTEASATTKNPLHSTMNQNLNMVGTGPQTRATNGLGGSLTGPPLRNANTLSFATPFNMKPDQPRPSHISSSSINYQTNFQSLGKGALPSSMSGGKIKIMVFK